MPHRIISTQADLSNFVTFLDSLKLPVTIEWVQGRDRSRDQNKLMWLWAMEASQQLGDRTQSEAQHDWKLRHGVPILRRDSDSFRKFYDAAIKHQPYEIRLAAMEYTPVTSQMKVRQMVEYLDTVQRECLQAGIVLTDPDPMLSDYQRKYRSK